MLSYADAHAHISCKDTRARKHLVRFTKPVTMGRNKFEGIYALEFICSSFFLMKLIEYQIN